MASSKRTSEAARKTKAFVVAARKTRAELKALGYSMGPEPTKAELTALAAWALSREAPGAPLAGLGVEAGAVGAGVLTGASAGAAAGPWGAAIGAVVGGVAGALQKAPKADKTPLETAKKNLQAANLMSKGNVAQAQLNKEAEQVKANAKSKWVLPAVLGGTGLLILGGGITLYLLTKKSGA